MRRSLTFRADAATFRGIAADPYGQAATPGWLVAGGRWAFVTRVRGRPCARGARAGVARGGPQARVRERREDRAQFGGRREALFRIGGQATFDNGSERSLDVRTQCAQIRHAARQDREVSLGSV